MISFSDMIAVPDYPLGAMENWGLITYRETRMLYDESVSTERNLASITLAIAHELSHQVSKAYFLCLYFLFYNVPHAMN